MCVSRLFGSRERPIGCVILKSATLLLACIKLEIKSTGLVRPRARHPKLKRTIGGEGIQGCGNSDSRVSEKNSVILYCSQARR